MLKSSDEITSDVLQGVEEMAGCFFVPAEIALALDIENTFFSSEMESTESAIYRAFQKGWIQSEFDQRKCIFQLALSGSSPAQTMVNNIRDKAKLKMM